MTPSRWLLLRESIEARLTEPWHPYQCHPREIKLSQEVWAALRFWRGGWH